MFLNVLQQRNPAFINAIIKLHQTGLLLPDSYVLDLDMIRINAHKMCQVVRQQGLSPFFISKQYGFNPIVSKAIIEAGFEGLVCVDFREAQSAMQYQLPLAHVGHLVQIPQHLLASIIQYGVQFITVYSIEKIEKINKICQSLAIKQKILIKIIADNGVTYSGQEGGFSLADLPALIHQIKDYQHIDIVGLTAFPCWLFDVTQQQIMPTANISLLHDAANIFENLGVLIEEFNLPSVNSVASAAEIAAMGGTQFEAGHSLTGTTPMHASDPMAIEKPAIAYVSEVSHHYHGKSYFYGGGLYRRYPIKRVFMGTDLEKMQLAQVDQFDQTSIDYYFSTDEFAPIGATVIACFRTQVFVTRSQVVVLEGVQSNNPSIKGIFSPQGLSYSDQYDCD